jgi:hypothetical protein
METVTSKLAVAGGLFLLTVIFGLIVSRSGRPLSIALVTVHKLSAVAAVVLVGLAVNQLRQTGDGLVLIEIGLIVISALLFIALIATGALLTREEMQLPEIVLKIHQIAPVLALACSTLTVFLLVRSNS